MEALKLPVSPLQERPTTISLTKKDVEILPYLLKGYSRDEIAEKLCLHVSSVAKRRARLYERLGVQDRMDLLRIAASDGIHYRNSMGEHKCYHMKLILVEK